jgi:hypothetical protein
LLDRFQHKLPKVGKILDEIWSNTKPEDASLLEPIGGSVPFCDGIGVPKTTLTRTERQVRELFQEFELKLFTVISKANGWFVKLDEDTMPDFTIVKERLWKLSTTANEKL